MSPHGDAAIGRPGDGRARWIGVTAVLAVIAFLASPHGSGGCSPIGCRTTASMWQTA